MAKVVVLIYLDYDYDLVSGTDYPQNIMKQMFNFIKETLLDKYKMYFEID